MSNYATIINRAGVTIYGPGEQVTIPSDKPEYAQALELLKHNRAAEAFAIATKYKENLAPAVKAVFGDVEVAFVHGEVRINGNVVHDFASEQVLAVVNRGIPPNALLNFIARVQKNPSYRARKDLFAWIDKNNMPVSADGCFIAFKIVKEDYWDIYTGNTFYHKPGSVVEMARHDVDDDPTRTCSAGAHFCGEGYIPHYGTNKGSRIVILKIAPEDVVAFPTDYNLAKGRAFRYEVIDEIAREDVVNYLGANRVYFDEDDSKEDYFDEDDPEFDEDDYENSF